MIAPVQGVPTHWSAQGKQCNLESEWSERVWIFFTKRSSSLINWDDCQNKNSWQNVNFKCYSAQHKGTQLPWLIGHYEFLQYFCNVAVRMIISSVHTLWLMDYALSNKAPQSPLCFSCQSFPDCINVIQYTAAGSGREHHKHQSCF